MLSVVNGRNVIHTNTTTKEKQMDITQIPLPSRMITEETRAEARRDLINAIAQAPLEVQFNIVKALHALGVVYNETTAVRAHQGLEGKALAYNKCAMEVGTIAGGVVASIQNKFEGLVQ